MCHYLWHIRGHGNYWADVSVYRNQGEIYKARGHWHFLIFTKSDHLLQFLSKSKFCRAKRHGSKKVFSFEARITKSVPFRYYSLLA